MTRFLAAAVLLALVLSASALAARGEPKREIRPADQARAKAIVLRQSDFGSNYKRTPDLPSETATFPCKVLDQSDLTVSGDGASEFRSAEFRVWSYARLYESVADVKAVWHRTTSKAGLACLRKAYHDTFAKSGAEVLSFGRIPFPKLTPRSFALRVLVRTQGVRYYFDFFELQHSRAHVSAAFISPRYPIGKELRLRLSRVLADRAKTAMRGA